MANKVYMWIVLTFEESQLTDAMIGFLSCNLWYRETLIKEEPGDPSNLKSKKKEVLVTS